MVGVQKGDWMILYSTKQCHLFHENEAGSVIIVLHFLL